MYVIYVVPLLACQINEAIPTQSNPIQLHSLNAMRCNAIQLRSIPKSFDFESNSVQFSPIQSNSIQFNSRISNCQLPIASRAKHYQKQTQQTRVDQLMTQDQIYSVLQAAIAYGICYANCCSRRHRRGAGTTAWRLHFSGLAQHFRVGRKSSG